MNPIKIIPNARTRADVNLWNQKRQVLEPKLFTLLSDPSKGVWKDGRATLPDGTILTRIRNVNGKTVGIDAVMSDGSTGSVTLKRDGSLVWGQTLADGAALKVDLGRNGASGTSTATMTNADGTQGAQVSLSSKSDPWSAPNLNLLTDALDSTMTTGKAQVLSQLPTADLDGGQQLSLRTAIANRQGSTGASSTGGSGTASPSSSDGGSLTAAAGPSDIHAELNHQIHQDWAAQFDARWQAAGGSKNVDDEARALAEHRMLIHKLPQSQHGSLLARAKTELAAVHAGTGSAPALMPAGTSALQTLADRLGPVGKGPPTMMLDSLNRPYLVFGTVTDAKGNISVMTQAAIRSSGTAMVPLAEFAKESTYMGSGKGIAGFQIKSPTGIPYTFEGVTLDTKTGQGAYTFKDSAGKLFTDIGTGLLKGFGVPGIAALFAAATGVAPSSAPPAVDTRAVSLNLVDATATNVKTWLAAHASPPPLATLADGSLATVVTDQANGQVRLTPLSGGPATEVPLASLKNTYVELDAGTGGQGTILTARATAGGVSVGQKLTFQALGSDSGGINVRVTDAAGKAKVLPLAQAVQIFGKAQMDELGGAMLASPTLPSDPRGKVSYGQLANTTLFTGPPSFRDVRQTGIEGDCYFITALSALAKKDPAAVAKMIRPSADGNPHDYDVTLYRTAGSQLKPVTITVNDSLPLDAQGHPAAAGVVSDAKGRPQIGFALIEKAYAQLKQETHDHGNTAGGYDGIVGGIAAFAMQTLTGKPATVSLLGDLTKDALVKSLKSANTGALVVLGTGDSNMPGTPLGGDGSGIVSNHAYTVLGTHTDPKTGELMVTLRNPWGSGAPDVKGGVQQTYNGEFTVPLSSILNGNFEHISLG